MALRDAVRRFFGTRPKQGSRHADEQSIEAFISDPNAPFLVSFPRTGSHWLRMIMELYFERPTLVRVFFFPEQTDYLLYHTHDMKLDVERRNVLYLYRDPVETIYSQIMYCEEDPSDQHRVDFWSQQYGRHLDKWLHREEFTVRKTVLTYEGMKQDLAAEFSKVCDHFQVSLDAVRLDRCAQQVNKEKVKEKTTHDPKVVTTKEAYSKGREQFREEMAAAVWHSLTAEGRDHLSGYFEQS